MKLIKQFFEDIWTCICAVCFALYLLLVTDDDERDW
jgi:hypothetical protein